MSLWGWIALILGVLLLLLLAAVALLVRVASARYVLGKRMAERQKHKPHPVPDSWKPYLERMDAEAAWFMAQSPESVEITSYDGLKLRGWYLPAGDGKRAILLMHGYRSTGGTSDFANMLRFYHGLGLSMLVIDQRGHARSEGEHICYGVKERYDCKSWLEWLNATKHPQDLFLAGLSMGAATVLMAAALTLPANLRCIIADCGYTSPWDICAHVVSLRYHLPAWLILPLANIGMRLYAGYALNGASATEAMLHNESLPVLFIHGGKDDFVPTAMGRANYEACRAPKQLYIVPLAGHAMSAWLDPKGVQNAIAGFVEKYQTI